DLKWVHCRSPSVFADDPRSLKSFFIIAQPFPLCPSAMTGTASKQQKARYNEKKERCPMSLQVRLAVAADAVAFADLYRPYVEQTAITFETEAPDAREFLSRIRNITRLNPWITVTEQEEVIGYAYYHPFHSRAAYQWWAEISVYLRQDCRGRGIGT